MSRFEIIEETRDYLLRFDREDKTVLLHINNPYIRIQLRESLLITHNGYVWIKSCGGRSLTNEKIKRIFGISEETLERIKQLLKK